jgi:chromosome segregation ATPase
MASLIAQISGLQSSVNEIKASLEKLAEGYTNTREFQAEARRRLDDSEKDRRDLWKKYTGLREQTDTSLKTMREQTEASLEAMGQRVDTAQARGDNAMLWLKLASAGFGAVLIAILAALLRK